MTQKYSKPSTLTTLLTDFIALMYPEICIGCGDALKHSDTMICFTCSIDLPITHFEHHPDNPVERLFWFKTQIESAMAGYFFSKKSRMQKMIHSFKYQGNEEAAIFMGEKIGHMLQSSQRFSTIDIVVPVPLHEEKMRLRGYNQAEKIGLGISNILNIPLVTESLIRNQHNATQTKKTLFNRWENVNSIFTVVQPEKIEHMHVLIVDDVITSGSTIEACAKTILKLPSTKISIASVAVATG
ncbi:MAG: ComF family protein [Salibacteraceae bacterium]|jgi:ComF family protein